MLRAQDPLAHRPAADRLTSEPSWLDIGLTIIGRSRVAMAEGK